VRDGASHPAMRLLDDSGDRCSQDQHPLHRFTASSFYSEAPVVAGKDSAKIVALRFPHFSACISVHSGRSTGTDLHPHNVDI
jgi:hypothetical protein